MVDKANEKRAGMEGAPKKQARKDETVKESADPTEDAKDNCKDNTKVAYDVKTGEQDCQNKKVNVDALLTLNDQKHSKGNIKAPG